MAKAFSLASWNVEHFKNERSRVGRVVDFLNEQNPDVFCLYEVEGSDVFDLLTTRMPGYQFHITEGPQVQEALVGVKRGITAFYTQRIEFKSGNRFLRPGSLLTLSIDGENYSVLFLHTKSSTQPLGLGIRDDQFRKALKLKSVLDRKAGGRGKANFLFLGDLNTMGMQYPFQQAIDADTELRKLDRDAGRRKMRRLTKSRPFSWWNGPHGRYPRSNLDHAVASDQLSFRQFSHSDIDVRGWPQLPTDEQQGKWIAQYSDHALLFLVVNKV